MQRASKVPTISNFLHSGRTHRQDRSRFPSRRRAHVLRNRHLLRRGHRLRFPGRLPDLGLHHPGLHHPGHRHPGHRREPSAKTWTGTTLGESIGRPGCFWTSRLPRPKVRRTFPGQRTRPRTIRSFSWYPPIQVEWLNGNRPLKLSVEYAGQRRKSDSGYCLGPLGPPGPLGLPSSSTGPRSIGELTMAIKASWVRNWGS